MALKDVLKITSRKKLGFSEERIKAVVPVMREYIAFWRDYPDLFMDFMQDGGDPNHPRSLNFYFYQRVFLRAAMRYKYCYMVFPRAYSKSFLSIMVLMIRCVLYPGAKLFVTSGGKGQSAGIMKEKVDEICALVPAFKREIDWTRGGKTVEGKDYCRYVFKNGSYFDNIAARESSRGKRRFGGLMEECVGIDGDILSSVILPIMNVSRRCLDGSVHPEEPLNKSQIYVTTAGYKNTFPYDKLMVLLVRMIVDPEKAIVLGGTWRIPVLAGLLDANWLLDLKRDETFNATSFDREYESKWAGSSADAFFDGEAFDHNRKVQQPEYAAAKASGANLSYYILSVDVGRKGCDTVVTPIKVIPQPKGQPSIKVVVNLFTLNDVHFEEQAIKLKKLFYQYKAKRMIIDANGLGIGLVDYMVKSQHDEATGAYYPPFGVYNDEDGEYKRFKTDDTEQEAMYLMKAHLNENTDAYTTLQSQLRAGKVKFLIDERTAKVKLASTKAGSNMSDDERKAYLKPFVLTSILKDELMNLYEEKSDGINIRLKQANSMIKKDKVSSLLYGLYYIKHEEDSKNKRKRFNTKAMMFFS